MALADYCKTTIYIYIFERKIPLLLYLLVIFWLKLVLSLMLLGGLGFLSVIIRPAEILAFSGNLGCTIDVFDAPGYNTDHFLMN